MKKLLYLLFVTLSFSVKSQITFVYSPNQYFEYPFNTTSLGEKYKVESSGQGITVDTVWIYNSDWSLYREVILPTGYTSYDFHSFNGLNDIPSISDKLFNSDSLLEFLIVKYVGNSRGFVSVINELGQIQYSFPDTIYTDVPFNIFTIEGNFNVFYQNSSGTLEIYSLPGTLPCNQCNYTTGIVEPNQGGGLSGLNVYPNPFNNSLEINYNFLFKQDNPRIIITDILGRELKSIPLVNQSDKITLNTTDLPRGTMVISLYGNSQNPVSKKVIKIN